MKAGFTGTRNGMSSAQTNILFVLLRDDVSIQELHHGDCVGADSQAHSFAQKLHIYTVAHPPSDDSLRAHCKYVREVRPVADYLTRDRNIVDETGILFATPSTETEPVNKRGSGTWYTIDYARKQGKPIKIIWPNGQITCENGAK